MVRTLMDGDAMTTNEQAAAILEIMQQGQESLRALYNAVLALDKRISAIEALLAEVRARGVMVLH